MWSSRRDWFHNHPLLKHFLQGVRCQHPVISGVAGGSWHPFRWAVKAVGQCLFLSFHQFFQSARKPPPNTSEHQRLFVWSFCLSCATTSCNIRFNLTERCCTCYVYMYVTSHELNNSSTKFWKEQNRDYFVNMYNLTTESLATLCL